MEQKFFIKLHQSYVVLLNENLMEEWGMYDLVMNKIHATKFNRGQVFNFNLKYNFLQAWNIKFGVKIA